MRKVSLMIGIVRLVVGVGLVGGCGLSWAAGPCATTPSAAVRSFEAGHFVEGLGGEGYRVTRVRRDAVLGTRWALVERCGHPEWPGVILPTESPVGAVDAGTRTTAIAVVDRAPRVVRAGETVRLWRQDTTARLEMTAVSEEGGAVGERVRMRVIARQENGESVRYLYGLVRGPADVEME